MLNTSPAFLKPRLAALALDFILISAYLIVIAAIGSFLAFGPFGTQVAVALSPVWAMDLLMFATTVLPVGGYFAVSEGSRQGATWGKKRMHIKVVRPCGGRLGWVRATLRAIVKLAPWQIAHLGAFRLFRAQSMASESPRWSEVAVLVALGLGAMYLLVPIVQPRRRAVHDMIAGSLVVSDEAGGAA